MAQKNIADKLQHKRSLLIERTAAALSISEEDAERFLRLERQQSVRLNPLRYTDKAQLLARLQNLGWHGEVYAWLDDGYTIEQGLTALRDSAPNHDGQIYLQNAASWLPVLALEPQPGERILDMCAAPGGKASHVAALTRNQAELWVNDNSRSRLAKMQANFSRLGVKVARVTLFDITHLAARLAGQQFDKILLDAPCSGEGLMTLRDTELQMWSLAHIKRLQRLQKRAILQAWELLKPGGTLVYSTCTIAPEENELIIDYCLRKAPGAQLQPLAISGTGNRYPAVRAWRGKPLASEVTRCLRLAPAQKLEAFFIAKVVKT